MGAIINYGKDPNPKKLVRPTSATQPGNGGLQIMLKGFYLVWAKTSSSNKLLAYYIRIDSFIKNLSNFYTMFWLQRILKVEERCES